MVNEFVGAVMQVLVFALVPFIVWAVTARRKESFLTWIGLRKPVCGNPLRAAAMSIAAAFVYMIVMSLCIRRLPEGITAAGSQFAGQGIQGLLSAFCYAFLRTALSEEILFRGFFLKTIQKRFGFVAGNTLQALLFGLAHGIPFGLVTKNGAVFVLLSLLPGLIGWYQGWLNEKQCGGSILPGWLIHGCVNLITAVLSL